MKKLLIVADTYYPKVDGTLRFMEEFITRAKEFDISLLVPHLGKKKGKHVTYLTPSRWFSLSGYPSLRLSLSNFHKIKQAVKKAEVVFVQGPAMISYLSIYYAYRYRKPVVFYLHVLSWELFEKFMPRVLSKMFFKIVKKVALWFYNRCSEVLVPYRDLKTQLERAGVRIPITIARLGVDIQRFTPADKQLSKRKMGINPDEMVIGYVGRISKEKNTQVLLEACTKIAEEQKIRLLMVGDGPGDQAQLCREEKWCTVTGFVNNVEKYLQAVDIFVMPSLTETTSLATLEAMATGVPVIVTKVGYMQNYVVKGHNGIFFPRNSATLLAIKIEKLLKDKDLREQLGRNARKTVAYSFSWERSINKIKRLLSKHIQHNQKI
jgi:glycosyltransferase involved in cell wall biosynthesis